MDIYNDQITVILYKQVQQISLTYEEQVIFDKWLEASDYNRQVFENLQSPDELRYYIEGRMNEENIKNAFQQFKMSAVKDGNNIPDSSRVDTKDVLPDGVLKLRDIRGRLIRWAAAAAIIISGAAGAYYLTSSSVKKTSPVVRIVQALKDIKPASHGAILKLGNGKTVLLDSMTNGVVAVQNGVQVLLKNGSLAYATTSKMPAEILTNTISTPNGRQFQLTLPDGTLVWLNSGSSITYPTIFNGSKRKVEISGEVYFEVTKNVDMPFTVSVNKKMEVEVLGTHFNINAYSDESSINTTLLEGAVKINNAGDIMQLKPEQQASLAKENKIKLITDPDIRAVMAWKNGLFNFDGANLEKVMRQLSRWYDISVRYEKNIPVIEFEGEMDRTVNLDELLKGLEGFGIHFRLEENRRLVVLP